MIDWARVSELYEQIGPDALPEVLALFTSEVAEGLERLKIAHEPHVISAEFHFLKGAALNLGLDEMARCCGEGENGAARGEDVSDQLDKVLDGFPRDCQTLLAEWQSQLGV